MPSNIKNENLWQEAKKTISKNVNVKKKPQMFYALVTNEYKRTGGTFIKPGPKGKRSIKKNPESYKRTFADYRRELINSDRKKLDALKVDGYISEYGRKEYLNALLQAKNKPKLHRVSANIYSIPDSQEYWKYYKKYQVKNYE